jgi:hypothetical protein
MTLCMSYIKKFEYPYYMGDGFLTLISFVYAPFFFHPLALYPVSTDVNPILNSLFA